MSASGEARPTRRVRWIVIYLACVVAALAAAFVAGSYVSSPWHEAAENADTPPTVTTQVVVLDLPVEPDVVVGVAAAGEAVNVPGPSLAGAESAVVTDVSLAVGDTVRSGSLLGSVSGIPVVALEMPFPMYRSLQVGAEGPDVVAIQEALSDLDVFDGPADGRYGARTAAALERLFASAGAPLPTTSSATSENASADGGSEPESEEARGASIPRGAIAAIGAPTATVQWLASRGDSLGESPLAILRVGRASVDARLSVDQLGDIAVGTTLPIAQAAVSGDPFEGTVTGVSEFREAADGAPPGYDVRVELPAGANVAEGGEYEVTVGSRLLAYHGLAVAATAVREDGDGTYVLVPDGDGAPVRTSVVVSGVRDGYALVQSEGLASGTVVIIQP